MRVSSRILAYTITVKQSTLYRALRAVMNVDASCFILVCLDYNVDLLCHFPAVFAYWLGRPHLSNLSIVRSSTDWD